MATTATDPNATPVSSPATTFLNPATGSIEPLTGTGTSAAPIELPAVTVVGTPPVDLTAETTAPQIWIATALPSTTTNAVTLLFDYMPESVSFGVSAIYLDEPVPYTSGRWLTYQNSNIDEVSVTVKVVAGCNNCLTYYGSNVGGVNSSYIEKGSLVASRFVRSSLVSLARFLYSLPLPANNEFANGTGQPPPTCRFKVGKMFSGVGAFTRVSIQFNGPYDYDGSPTDMDVTLGFNPSEFYDSGQFAGMSTGLVPKTTPTGEGQITKSESYALVYGDTQLGQGTPITPPANPNAPNAANTPNQGPELVGTVPESQVQSPQGPQTPTPTNQEVAIATGYPENQVFYNSAKDTYTLGGTYTPGGTVVGGTEYTGDNIRKQVANSKTANLGGGD